jgi:hypothetical protein
LKIGEGAACLWKGMSWIEYPHFLWRTWNANNFGFEQQVKSSYKGFNLTNCVQSLLSCFIFNLRLYLKIITDNALSNYSIMNCLPNQLESGGRKWSGEENYLSYITSIKELTLKVFMDSLDVKGWLKSWEDRERDQIA